MSDQANKRTRRKAVVVTALWVLGALAAVLLLADPFDFHRVNESVLSLAGIGGHAVANPAAEAGAAAAATPSKGSTAHQLWTCPMHPNVIEEEPGQCPICNMDLVPVKADLGTEEAGGTAGGAAAGAATAISGTATATSSDAAAPSTASDASPSTGSAVSGTDAAPETEGKQLWTCGMHPQVIQDHPGTCPICHMDLTPLKTGTAQAAEVPHASHQGMTVTIDPAVVQNMNVRTAVVGRRDLSRQVRTVGYLDYDQEKMVSVTTRYSGFIEKAYVNYIGQPVRKGEPLFEVYSPELVQTSQELMSARRYAERLSNAPAETRQRAEALLASARARLSYWDISPDQIDRIENSSEPIRTLTVTAPAGGVVMKRMDALEGMAVKPGMELLHIADISSLWLSVEVFEDQLPWIDVGSTARVTLSYFPGETLTGKVRYVEPQVSDKTRSLRVTLEVPNPRQRLKAGMYATVEFEPTVAANAIVVPSQAVIRTGERNVIVVSLGQGRFAPRDVVLGPEGDGDVQVLSGVDAGEEIVTSAQFLIDSESNLKAAIQKMIDAHSH